MIFYNIIYLPYSINVEFDDIPRAEQYLFYFLMPTKNKFSVLKIFFFKVFFFFNRDIKIIYFIISLNPNSSAVWSVIA